MSMISLFDEAMSLRIVQTLLHFLWQGTCIGFVAFALDAVVRRGTARAKYLLHVSAMLAMALCLPITFARIAPTEHTPIAVDSPTTIAVADAVTIPANAAPARSVPILRSEDPISGDASTLGDPWALTSANEADPVATQATSNDGRFAKAQGTGPRMVINESERVRGSVVTLAAPFVALAYITCVAVLIARLLIGVWGGHKLRRSSVAITDTRVVARLSRQAERIGLRLAPAIAYCEQISVPVVVGILRPAILLPSSLALGLTPDQLDSLLAHELAHLRRYDPLVNLLQRTVEAVIFFHPAIWYVSRRIDVEREHASDDMVLHAGWERIHYADALVRMAELSELARNPSSARQAALLAASGGNPSDFKRRVMRLLVCEPSNVRLTKSGVTVFLTVVVALAFAPLAVRSWAQRAADSGEERESSVAPADGVQLGRVIDDFVLQDYLGTKYALRDLEPAEIVVVAFVGTECPLAKLYGPQLARLSDQYTARGVRFIGINSNQQDTPTELGHYARKHHIQFPLLKDPGNRVADQFRAERTPEVFVLDRQRTVRYWGRIDDQFGVGYARPAATNNYLAKALEELLAGKAVTTPRTEPVGCHIGRVTRVAPTGEINYTRQISRIMQQRCVECHRADGIAPFALQTYEDVAAWAETISEVVSEQRMPPWHANPKFGHFANDGRMPEAEKELLHRWVDNGVPRGSLEELPPQREFVDGWTIGEPDLVLTMPEPITVTPTGVIDYQYVTVDPHFTEGKWIRASEIRPGVRGVVHHIIVFINPPGGDPILKERGVGFETVGGYVPGAPPMQLREGVARYVPPGSTFVFQIHYTPDGTERHDQSQIGLYFADPQTVHRTVQTGVAANLDLVVPAFASNHRVEATHRFSHDMEVYTLAPHMHYRGKAFRFEVTYPNGSREILLDIPRYDFNWQNEYRLAEPKFIPEGTLLKCVAYFDNSKDNPSNPDPAVDVPWGEQTWDEMMIGYFEGVFLNQDLSLPEPQITPVGDGTYRVRFTYKPDRPAKNIYLAGTFNDWNNMSHALTDSDGDGIYHADAIVPKGEHRYKFVIDGSYWTHDPASRILTGFLHESFFVAGRETSPHTGE